MVEVGSTRLSFQQLDRIIQHREAVSLAPETVAAVERAHHFLEAFCVNKVIYGINTGLGPMTQYRVSDDALHDLQYNLIRSHSAGCGVPIPDICVRAAMVARLVSLARGRSGVHSDAVHLLVGMLNHDILPVIPEHGGVGASGDLVQLSHLALAMIGEGDVHFRGERRIAGEVFSECGLAPLSMYIREGLSLINGTSVMTGIGIVNLGHARNLCRWMVLASTLLAEITESYDDYFSDELNRVKHHAGQRDVAGAMRDILSGSRLVRRRSDHLYDRKLEVDQFEDKVQEYYSIRCAPQIIGPVLDTLRVAEEVLLDEMDSVSDNPIVDVESGSVYHGGNFHGDYVSLEMDKMKTVVTRLSMLAERHINFLMNSKLNGKLPPFVNLGVLGLNLGMQGVQFTAVSTTAENQTLSYPMYLHSIPNNNDNQDIVSMGTNAALLARRVIMNTYEVLAVEFLSIIQAIDHLGYAPRLSVAGGDAYARMRALVPVFRTDEPRYRDLALIRDFLVNNSPEYGKDML